MKKLRILHCAHLVGGQASSLAREERNLGASSLSVAWQDSVFGYPVDEIIWREDASLYSQEIARWRLLARAVNNFNVIHYNYGSPILNWGALNGRHRFMFGGLGGLYSSINQTIELPLVKLMGSVVAVTYQGDDARQGDYCRSHFDICIANEVNNEYYSSFSDKTKRKRISKFGRYADLIYALNPDLLHVLPSRAKFLPYAHVDLDKWQCQSERLTNLNRRPLVVHAPSHRKVKGTEFILNAVKQLKEEGVNFDFQLIEGLTQLEAKKLYEKADLVIDQLLAGWYGGFSVEVMTLGKPVICYLRRDDFIYIPKEMADEIPIIEASPESIKSVLKDWICRSTNERRERGLEGKRFVRRWHNPKLIAQQLLNDYTKAIQSKRSICVE